MRKTALLVCLTVLPVTLPAEPLTITRSVETDSGGMRAIIAVAEYATGFNLEVAFICLERTPEIITQLGPAGFRASTIRFNCT